MQPDHFDVFGPDEHGASADYWAGYRETLARLFSLDSDRDDESDFDWPADEDDWPVILLTDAELDAIDQSIDDVPDDVDLPAWFAPTNEGEIF